MQKPLLVAITGMAMSGKNTLATKIAERFHFPYFDIDDLMINIFGMENRPRPDPNLIDLSSLRTDEKERWAVYNALMFVTEKLLESQQSIIITATFSGASARKKLRSIADKTGAAFKLVRCHPSNDGREEIEKRIASRTFGVNTISLIVNYDQYLYTKGKIEPYQEPHCYVDTSEPIEKCLEKIVSYINSPA